MASRYFSSLASCTGQSQQATCNTIMYSFICLQHERYLAKLPFSRCGKVFQAACRPVYTYIADRTCTGRRGEQQIETQLSPEASQKEHEGHAFGPRFRVGSCQRGLHSAAARLVECPRQLYGREIYLAKRAWHTTKVEATVTAGSGTQLVPAISITSVSDGAFCMPSSLCGCQGHHLHIILEDRGRTLVPSPIPCP